MNKNIMKYNCVVYLNRNNCKTAFTFFYVFHYKKLLQAKENKGFISNQQYYCLCSGESRCIENIILYKYIHTLAD